MKKILFVIPEYSFGGTNKSLENLLALMDKEKYDISVYSLYEDGGDYYKKEFAPFVLKKSRLYYWLHDNEWTRKMMGLYNKLTKRDNFTWLYRREAQYLLQKHDFDVVVAYQEGTSTEFVSYFNDAVKKIAWIHFDYSMWKGRADIRSAYHYYDKFHRIVCVSEAAMKSMLSVYPEYKDKAVFIYNTINSEKVKKQAEDIRINVPFSRNVFNILSVGRFVGVKNFHLIPKIVANIKEITKKPFCWYIMGDGEYLGEIERSIEEYTVANYVKPIQAQDNPYPFFKKADLHVCLSDHESFSYTLAESKVLHTPVLSNDFPVAYEVVDDQTGWIASIKDMPQLLACLVEYQDGMYHKKKDSIAKYEYSNHDILQRIDELFENKIL